MKAKKLKTPAWQNLIYLAFVVFGPLIIVYLEAVHTGKGWFIATMTLFILGMVAITLINSFLIKPWKTKCLAQMATLELNYQSGVGKPHLTRRMWAWTGFKMFLWDAGTLLFYGVGIWLFCSVITASLKSISIAIMLMLSSVLIGLTFKAFCYLSQMKETPEEGGTP